MAQAQINLKSELFHADAAELLKSVQAAIEAGNCQIDASKLEKIAFGPFQVLVAAQREAEARGTEFAIHIPTEAGPLQQAQDDFAMPALNVVLPKAQTKKRKSSK